MNQPEETKKNLLSITRLDQYRAVSELFEASQPNSIYYSLLLLSTLIVASGLLLSNAAIVIGGMLVTPVLTPLLVIALGITTGELVPIKREAILTLKSFAIIVVASLILGLILGTPEEISIFENTLRTAVLYFVVALVAGAAAAFAWARKEMAVALPGMAVAVSLVPPLALVGIGLSILDLSVVRFYLFITLFNLLGIIIGSLIVFSLLKFSRAEKEVHHEAEKVEKANE